MEKVKFSTTIRASKDQVWRAMLEDATYRDWTSAFHEGSYAVTDWKEGSKALFLTPEGEGMASRIAVHRRNEFLSIEHTGLVKDGVEDAAAAAAAQGWSGAHEDYRVHETGGVTELTVEMDVVPEYRKYFEETWPRALDRLKQICESVSAGKW